DVSGPVAAPGPPIWTPAVPRLGSALAARDTPAVVVLDDTHLIGSRESLDAVCTVVQHLPEGSLLVLAGRTRPKLRIANLRAKGQLCEIGVDRLALTPHEARLLLRATSILERMCGSLCDGLLDDEGSARELERIERSNLFLVPLDTERNWYRYHHLFRDLLERELAEFEPHLLQGLHGRAADWFERHGDPESALEHALSAGDLER